MEKSRRHDQVGGPIDGGGGRIAERSKLLMKHLFQPPQAHQLLDRRRGTNVGAHLGLYDPRDVAQPEGVRNAEHAHGKHGDERPRARSRLACNRGRRGPWRRRDVNEEEGKREEGHAANHAEQRPEEERSSADAINQAERDDGRDEIGDGDEDSKGGRLTETGLVDDFGGASQGGENPESVAVGFSCDCDSTRIRSLTST